MLVECILKFYSEFEKDREWSDNVFRASSAGSCARRLAYQKLGFEAIPLTARARMVFRLGDLVEKDMVDVALKFGLQGIQESGECVIDGIKITGSCDGWIDQDGEKVVVDFKSISDFGFKRAEIGEVDYGYKCQMMVYMKIFDAKKGLLVFYKKHTSHICEVLVQWDNKVWEEIVKRFKEVEKATEMYLPEREYGPDEKKQLKYPCSYCAYVKHCFPNYELTFDAAGKPKLTLREKKDV